MSEKKYPDLGLTNDEVVARYLRHIADGPECAETLREQGFDAWCQMWWDSHERQAGIVRSLEWDSRNYSAEDMRAIYDAIIVHSSRAVKS